MPVCENNNKYVYFAGMWQSNSREKGKYQWKRKMKHTLTDEIEVFQDNTFRITGLNNISSIVFKFI